MARTTHEAVEAQALDCLPWSHLKVQMGDARRAYKETTGRLWACQQDPGTAANLRVKRLEASGKIEMVSFAIIRRLIPDNEIVPLLEGEAREKRVAREALVL